MADISQPVPRSSSPISWPQHRPSVRIHFSLANLRLEGEVPLWLGSPSSGLAEACWPPRPLSLSVPPAILLAILLAVLLPVLLLGLLDLLPGIPLLIPHGGSGVPVPAPAIFYFSGLQLMNRLEASPVENLSALSSD